MKKTLCFLLMVALALTGASALAEEERTTIEIFMQIQTEFDPDTSPIVPALEEACGVNLEFILPPINSYEEQLNLMVASGDYPDLVQFMSTGAANFQDSAENGILLPLDDYIENYPNLQAYIDPASWTAMRSAVSDGKLYGVPRNSVMRTDGWFVRDDWLENVGIELEDCSTVSKQEFYDMLYAFTYNDPDGNGEDDTYGLATGSVNLLFPGAFDVLGWQEAPEGSEYAYMSAQYDRNSSAYVDALAYTAKLWMDGLIDPNDITNEGNAYRDRFYEGTVGVVRTFGGWLNTYEPALQENFPDAKVKYIVGIENDEGECVGTSTLGGNIYGFVSLMSPAAGKEDAILGLLDYMLSDEGWSLICDGVEGWTYTVENGEKVPTEAFTDFSVYRNDLSLVRRYNDPGYFVLLNNADYDRSWQYIQAACDITVSTLDMGYVPQAAQSNDYMDYATEFSVALNDILIGNQPADTWYTVLNDWYEFGGEAYVQEMNDYIASLNEGAQE